MSESETENFAIDPDEIAAELDDSWLPQTPEAFAEMMKDHEAMGAQLANSPGARAMAEAGRPAVTGRLDAHAEALGGHINDPDAAIQTAEELYAAAVRSGEVDDPQGWAIRSAAQAASGRDTYESVIDRWAVKTHGKVVSAPLKRPARRST